MDTPTKRCSRCKLFKPFADFNKSRAQKDGYDNNCRDCGKLIRSERPESRTEYNKNYRINNHDRITAKEKQWYGNNKRHKMASNKTWRDNNKERFNVKSRIRTAKRRAIKQGAAGKYTDQDVHRQYKAQHGKCYWCGEKVGKHYHVDHVIPLSRGGSNGPDNLVIACVFCNESKHNKLPHEWEGNGGKLL